MEESSVGYRNVWPLSSMISHSTISKKILLEGFIKQGVALEKEMLAYNFRFYFRFIHLTSMRAQLHDRLKGQMEIDNSDKGVVFAGLSA